MFKVNPELIGELEGKVTNLSSIIKSVEKELNKIPSIEDDIKMLNASIQGLQETVLKIAKANN